MVGTINGHNIGQHSRIYALPLPIPPLPEQRAIAAALSDVDALLGGLDRLIAKKRDLKQAAMQQLLTGQTRLPGFHGEWEVKTPSGDLFMTGDGMNSRSELSTSIYRSTIITASILDRVSQSFTITRRPHCRIDRPRD